MRVYGRSHVYGSVSVCTHNEILPRACDAPTLSSDVIHRQQPLKEPLTWPLPRPTRHIKIISQKPDLYFSASTPVPRLPDLCFTFCETQSRVLKKMEHLSPQRVYWRSIFPCFLIIYERGESPPYKRKQSFSSSFYLSLSNAYLPVISQIRTTSLYTASKFRFMRIRADLV